MNEIIIMIAITNNKLLKWWGVYIYSKNGSIDFNNCTICNNTIQHAGGGVLILSFGNDSIDFCDCTIQINSAWAKGEGVHIYSNGSDSFKFSSWIYNDTAYLGSGMLQQLAFFLQMFHFISIKYPAKMMFIKLLWCYSMFKMLFLTKLKLIIIIQLV